MSRRLRRNDSSSSSESELEAQRRRQPTGEFGTYEIGGGYYASHPSTSRSPGPPSVTGSGNDPIRRIYRSSDRERALRYVASGDTRHITTSRAGDFHTNQNQSTAYFTFSRRYADLLASNESPGYVIEQRPPASLLTGDDTHYFDERPSPEWRTVVRANRAQELLGRDNRNLRHVQRSPIVVGPTADVSSDTLLNRLGRHPHESQAYRDAFRPVVSSSSDSDSDIDASRRERTYTQQIAIRGEALERLSNEPRYARPPRPRIVRSRRT